jgi:putative membrane protein
MGPKHLLLLGALMAVGCQDNNGDTRTTTRRDRDSMSDNRGSTGKDDTVITETTAGGSGSGNMSGQTSMSGEASAMKDGKLAQPGSLSARDQQFVLNAASSGMFEMKSSQMAASRSNDAEVKQFAQQMLKDHEKVNTELASLVRGKGAAVPTTLVPRHQKMLETLSKADDDKFAQVYKHGQGVAHDEAINLFEAASKNLDDADLKAFAARNLSALKMHKDMLKDNSRHMGH